MNIGHAFGKMNRNGLARFQGGILILSAMLFLCVPAAAQESDNNWQVTLMPFLMGSSIDGTATVRGQKVEVDRAASDILANLKFGSMIMGMARKGDWGIGADAVWMDLDAGGDATPPADLTFRQGIFSFYGLRRLGPAVDLTFGARINFLKARLDMEGPSEARYRQNKTWVDPVVGLCLHTLDDAPTQFQIYSEIGGFNTGSRYTWRVFPTVSFHLSSNSSLSLGYRWLYTDYEDGRGSTEFHYKMLVQGPLAGLILRF